MKQIIKKLTEEFADLTELIKEKKYNDNLIEEKKSSIILSKKENSKENILSIDSINKFSFGMEFQEKIQSSKLLLNNIKSSPNILLNHKNQNLFLNPTNSNSTNSQIELPKKFNSFKPNENNIENSNLNINNETRYILK